MGGEGGNGGGSLGGWANGSRRFFFVGSLLEVGVKGRQRENYYSRFWASPFIKRRPNVFTQLKGSAFKTHFRNNCCQLMFRCWPDSGQGTLYPILAGSNR